MPLRHDISQNYALKAAIKQLLGNQAWLDLKETASITTWRKYVMKILDAIEVSIRESVQVRDKAWVIEVQQNLSHGRALAKASKDIEALLSNQ